MPKMKLVHTDNKNEFWRSSSGRRLYNISKKGSGRPTGGYHDPEYILRVKGYYQGTEALRIFKQYGT